MATSVCRRENGMNALSIANYIVNNWSDKIEITNLKLNKLVYYSYVESLRKLGRPLFDDARRGSTVPSSPRYTRLSPHMAEIPSKRQVGLRNSMRPRSRSFIA